MLPDKTRQKIVIILNIIINYLLLILTLCLCHITTLNWSTNIGFKAAQRSQPKLKSISILQSYWLYTFSSFVDFYFICFIFEFCPFLFSLQSEKLLRLGGREHYGGVKYSPHAILRRTKFD